MKSTDLTRIFAVVTVLTLIIYADPGTAGSGSAEDTVLVNLPDFGRIGFSPGQLFFGGGLTWLAGHLLRPQVRELIPQPLG